MIWVYDSIKLESLITVSKLEVCYSSQQNACQHISKKNIK